MICDFGNWKFITVFNGKFFSRLEFLLILSYLLFGFYFFILIFPSFFAISSNCTLTFSYFLFSIVSLKSSWLPTIFLFKVLLIWDTESLLDLLKVAMCPKYSPICCVTKFVLYWFALYFIFIYSLGFKLILFGNLTDMMSE